jgi:hypothetical protein
MQPEILRGNWRALVAAGLGTEEYRLVIGSLRRTKELGPDRLAVNHAPLLLAMLAKLLYGGFPKGPARYCWEPVGSIKSRQGIVQIKQSQSFIAKPPAKEG